MKDLIFKLFKEPTSNTFIQLFRYVFVGGLAFFVDYCILFLLTEYAGVPYLISAAIAFVAGLVVNYLISISWVFSESRSDKPAKEFFFFAVIGAIGLGINELIMWVGTDLMQIHYMISKIISTMIVFFWNFFARKTLLFNK